MTTFLRDTRYPTRDGYADDEGGGYASMPPPSYPPYPPRRPRRRATERRDDYHATRRPERRETNVGENDPIQQVLAILRDFKADVTTRLDSMDEKFDKLPATYATQREHQSLTEQVQGVIGRQERFEEWRAGMIERQYQTILGLSQRADDGATREVRNDLATVQTQANRAADTHAGVMASARSRLSNWTIAGAGWGFGILMFILSQIAPHLHWIP